MNEEMTLARKLIAENRIEKAFEVLFKLTTDDPDLHNQLLTLSARYSDVHGKEMLGMIGYEQAATMYAQINYALVQIIDEIIKRHKTVFISYNHQDAETATRILEKLRALNINVIIDREKMQAGQDIKSFIEESVRNTKITLSVVSGKSLLSSWVGMETINTFNHEISNATKKFIACYLDDDFQEPGFTSEALNSLEGKIKEINKGIASRMEEGLGFDDLYGELRRMADLKNNLDKIIARLKGSLCIDLGQENFEKNFHKIVQAIQS